ncbi:unnamed protein product [Bursaphelenchus okinawaensis]|uniref:glucuronosyltransferase n=1 Tax=Bursaphelenchus okinawaensis TaxID=465554 RepID=A0A811KUN4_9BILA|nr:unnamed protein product [Bursaphelenchus okinawaensis]CAG9113542.1 unnamed protein product [Bursaphelenchus okinawaensis]
MGTISALVLLVLAQYVKAGEVALVASSGCYSHDVMMREVGEQFTHQNVTWLQAYLFEFGFGEMKIPNHWGRVQVTRTLNNVAEMNELGGFLVWLGNVPLHWERWWDLRGASFFVEILRYHQRHCEDFVKSEQFLQYMNSKDVSLLVIDHFLQECMVGAASLLNASTVQFSNWPIADGYVTSLNVPSNPSSTPKTGNAFSSTKTMEFGIRVKNTIFHSLIVLARVIQSAVVQSIYKEWGYDVNIIDVEAKHILYASRGEFLAEPVRPLNNRIKYFGCSRCGDPEQYKIKRPVEYNPSYSSESKSTTISNDIVIPPANITISLSLGSNVTLCSKCLKTKKVSTNKNSTMELPIGRVLSVQETRWIQNKVDFPLIDWDLLEERPFVIVSFGSVAHAKYMPDALFDRFLEDFGKSPHTIIWQTNDVTERLRNRTIPDNLHIVRWVPMKVMLAHHNLHYAMLHCGVNTVNELLSFGIPILSVPMQGDQPSNSRRLKDLGLADVTSIADFWAENGLANVMAEFENGLQERRERAKKVANMISHYREVHGQDQHFWLEWSQRHGQMFRDRMDGQRYFEMKYRSSFEYYAMREVIVFSSIVVSLVLLLSHTNETRGLKLKDNIEREPYEIADEVCHYPLLDAPIKEIIKKGYNSVSYMQRHIQYKLPQVFDGQYGSYLLLVTKSRALMTYGDRVQIPNFCLFVITRTEGWNLNTEVHIQVLKIDERIS